MKIRHLPLLALLLTWAFLDIATAKTIHFTQIGSGASGRLVFRTVFQITNENPVEADGAILLFQADGAAMESTLEAQWVNQAGQTRTEGNRLDFTIPPRSSLRLILPPGPQVSVGWATLQGDLDLSAGALTQFAEAGGEDFEGRLISEVESLGSPGMAAFSFPLTYLAGARPIETAFALTNTSTVAATVTLLRRPDDEVSIVLEPGGVYSAYLSQVWPTVVAAPRFDGLAEVRSSVPLGSLVFRTLAGLPLSGVAAGPAAAGSGEIETELGTEFVLALNQTGTIAAEALSVTFSGISEDSRCPSDVTCIWEGQARVSVELSRNGGLVGEAELTLRAGNQEMARATVGGYVVQAVRLDPYPATENGPIKAEDYRLALTIRLAEQ